MLSGAPEAVSTNEKQEMSKLNDLTYTISEQRGSSTFHQTTKNTSAGTFHRSWIGRDGPVT